MAILSSDGTYVTVERRDNLWSIAAKFLGSGLKYKTLAAINDIVEPDYVIHTGQKIYLTDKTSSTSNTETANANRVTINHFGEQSTATNTLFVMWSWSKESQTESYKILWSYKNADGIWLVESPKSNSVDEDAPEASRYATYNVPTGALSVKVKILPVAKTKTVNNKEVSEFEANWSEEKTWTAGSNDDKLAQLSAPSPEITKDKLTVTYEGISEDGSPKKVEFEVRKNEESKSTYTNSATITDTRVASYSWTVPAGNTYRVRARLVRDKVYGEWSDWSGKVSSSPLAPSSITKIAARKDTATGEVTSVYLEWDKVENAETYDIEWYAAIDDMGASVDIEQVIAEGGTPTGNQTTETSDSLDTVEGLASGNEYFFRVRSKVGSDVSSWSPLKSVILGKKPAAPTAWASTTTAIAGEPVVLYWVHNSTDGSQESWADLEIYVGDTKFITEPIQNVIVDGETQTTRSYTLETSSDSALFVEGAKITWRVRTAGIATNENGATLWGDWSTRREIVVYAPPSLSFSILNASNIEIGSESAPYLESFPFTVNANPDRVYTNQDPIGYYLSIVADESYETVDNIGNDKTVKMGDVVYSKIIDDAAVAETISAGDVSLENNISYTVTCKVAMSSGLTASTTRRLIISWTEESYSPTAEIGLDPTVLTAQIRPYCEERTIAYYKLEENADGTFTKTEDSFVSVAPIRSLTYRYNNGFTDEEIIIEGNSVLYRYISGVPVYKGTMITYDESTDSTISTAGILYWTKSFITNATVEGSGETVVYGAFPDDTRGYYCKVETAEIVEDVLLSVYRREYDGTYTLIAEGLENIKGTTVTDPHPALDYARYRIVATSTMTGSVSYSDLPGYPVGGNSVIIQWDEEWTPFETNGEQALEQPAWTGSMLSLPYNVDVSDSTSIDVSLVEYVGRSHPVSYYGTHIGETASWGVVIPKEDKETIYALRRLSRWMGDVYVREPSGTGYWANIKVSFSQKHCDPAVPVTLDITRVEGGM